MDTEHFKKLLLAKERDLQFELSGLNGEAQRPEGAEASEWMDRATTEVETDENVGEAASLTATLDEVRKALQRIKDGTYGKCAESGHPIETARLEALPWTAVCLKHERSHKSHQGIGTQ
jgi:DnaK suppressor protein